MLGIVTLGRRTPSPRFGTSKFCRGGGAALVPNSSAPCGARRLTCHASRINTCQRYRCCRLGGIERQPLEAYIGAPLADHRGTAITLSNEPSRCHPRPPLCRVVRRFHARSKSAPGVHGANHSGWGALLRRRPWSRRLAAGHALAAPKIACTRGGA